MADDITLLSKGDVVKTRILTNDALYLIKEVVKLPTGITIVHADVILHDRRDDSYGKIEDFVTQLNDMARWGVEFSNQSEWDDTVNRLVGADGDDFEE